MRARASGVPATPLALGRNEQEEALGDRDHTGKIRGGHCNQAGLVCQGVLPGGMPAVLAWRQVLDGSIALGEGGEP